MNLSDLTQDDLDTWRVNPVTEILKACLGETYSAQKDMCLQAYWAGQPWPEADVKSLQRMGDMLEDMFGASKEDLSAVMEQIDATRKPIGDNPD